MITVFISLGNDFVLGAFLICGLKNLFPSTKSCELTLLALVAFFKAALRKLNTEKSTVREEHGGTFLWMCPSSLVQEILKSSREKLLFGTGKLASDWVSVSEWVFVLMCRGAMVCVWVVLTCMYPQTQMRTHP